MNIERHDIDVETGTGGTATSYSAAPVSARILQIHFVPATSAGLGTAGTVTLKGEVTAETIWAEAPTGSCTRIPRRAPTNTASVSATNFREPFYVANERLKVTVTGAGASKSGIIRVITG